MGNKDVVHRWQEVPFPLSILLFVCDEIDLTLNGGQALALMAQPSNVPTSLKELAALSDEIWFLSGDASVDTSWYTKRASLSTIYATTELFMTTDKKLDYADTREFLDRRFKDIQVVGGAMGNVGQWVGFTAQAGLNVLRSKGVRI